MRIHITNGHVIDPANGIDARQDIFIEDDRIVAVSEKLDGFTADETIDANGLWVLPGLIDLAARLREPGLDHKAVDGRESPLMCQGKTHSPIRFRYGRLQSQSFPDRSMCAFVGTANSTHVLSIARYPRSHAQPEPYDCSFR